MLQDERTCRICGPGQHGERHAVQRIIGHQNHARAADVLRYVATAQALRRSRAARRTSATAASGSRKRSNSSAAALAIFLRLPSRRTWISAVSMTNANMSSRPVAYSTSVAPSRSSCGKSCSALTAGGVLVRKSQAFPKLLDRAAPARGLLRRRRGRPRCETRSARYFAAPECACRPQEHRSSPGSRRTAGSSRDRVRRRRRRSRYCCRRYRRADLRGRLQPTDRSAPQIRHVGLQGRSRAFRRRSRRSAPAR